MSLAGATPFVHPRGEGRSEEGTGPLSVAAAEALFRRHVERVRDLVEPALEGALARREEELRGDGRSVCVVLGAVRDLVLRGGKRQRAALVAAAYEACGGRGGLAAVVPAGVSLELLQAYFLVHDDWMDRDGVRRGGPAVHVAVDAALASGASRGEGAGAVGAVLGGDWLAAVAQAELVRTLEVVDPHVVSPAAVLAAMGELARMQECATRGQILDTLGTGDDRELARVHALKTGSYTVEGPLAVGARLAGATPEQRGALARFARPLGLAFQLRDDFLGTFGEPTQTGKPVASDLVRGARTAVASLARRDPALARLLDAVQGGGAPAGAVDLLVERLRDRGVDRRLEERIQERAFEAAQALEGAPFSTAGYGILLGAVGALTRRPL